MTWFRPMLRPATLRAVRRPDPADLRPAAVEPLEQRRLLSGNPSLSIGDVSVAEGGAGGTTAFTFTVSLSAPAAKRVGVTFSTADGTATAGSDYVAAAGTIRFDRGQSTKTITVLATGDATYEGTESFFVNLTRAANAVIADGQAVGVIVDDDVTTPDGHYIDPATGLATEIPPGTHIDGATGRLVLDGAGVEDQAASEAPYLWGTPA